MLNRFFVAAIVGICLTGCVSANELSGPRNVLFVGNSFTYYNNSLHNHYRALVQSTAPDDERPGRVRSMTISGGQLPEHAAGLPSMLNSEKWQIVVLQAHSRGPIEAATAEAFRRAARDYVEIIRDSGAEPVFFMTWAYTDKPEMTVMLDRAYTGIGQALNAQVIPVGLAFAAATAERPEIQLRAADAQHPSLAGTYLAACTFFAALHDTSPVGNQYIAGLDKETAVYLQGVASSTVGAYDERKMRQRKVVDR